MTTITEDQKMSLTEIIEERRIQKVNAQPRSIKQMARNPKTLNFELAIQRNLKWSVDQKSALIESLLLGYPIPPVYSLRSDDKVAWLYDGKQRLTTLISFFNNEWALGELTELEDTYEIDLEGMKYEDLPEELQELIADTQIVFYQFEKLEEMQRDSLFKRLNSGTPLTNIELTRSILGTTMLEYIMSLSETEFFKYVSITEKQEKSFTHQEMLLQVIGIITGKVNDLSGDTIQKLALDLRDNNLTDEEKTLIDQVFNYLADAFKDKDAKKRSKILKKNDIIAIVGSAIDTEVTAEVFGNNVFEFLLKQSTQYKDTKRGGTASADKIAKRINILKSVANG